MNDLIQKRIIDESNYIIENKATVRETSKIFGVSKSTVHYDLTKKLKEIDTALYEEVKKQLYYNKSIRHIRGGNATRLMYQLEHRK